MEKLVDFLSQISLLHWVLSILACLIPCLILIFGFIRWLLRKELRLYKGLRRPIIILRPINSRGEKIPGTEMDSEIELLKGNELLNIDSTIPSYRDFDPSLSNGIVVIGYHSDMTGLGDLLQVLRNMRAPLVVYTFGENVNAIKKEDKEQLATYPFTTYANFQLTLINQIFATAASFPFRGK